MAAGTYVENLQVTSDHSGVHLAGRCMELVVIDASEGSEDDYTEGSGIYLYDPGFTAKWTVSGVTLAGAPFAGILQEFGELYLARMSIAGNTTIGIYTGWGTLVTTDILVQDNDKAGVMLVGSSATMESVRVLDNHPDASGVGGRGFHVQEGSTLAASNCLVQGNLDYGVYLSNSTATLVGVQVLDTQVDDNGEFGCGLEVQDGSTLVATDCIVQGNHAVGISIWESTAVLEGGEVLDTQPNADRWYGYGIFSQDGSLLMTDCLVRENQAAGVVVSSSTATLEGVQILDTQVDGNGEYGMGLAVQDESSLTAADCLVQGNHFVGVNLSSSTATLEGVQVLDTQVDDNGYGRGLQVTQGCTLEATDCLVQGSHDLGVLVSDSTATLEGVQILDTGRDTVGSFAVGLGLQSDAAMEATGLTVQNTDGPALYVVLQGQLTCTDCTLTDNSFAGAVVQNGGKLVLADSLIEGTVSGSSVGAGLGVFVDGKNYSTFGFPTLTLQGSTILDNEMGAVYIKGAGTYQVVGNDLSGGSGLTVDPGLWTHGDAVFITTGEEVPTAWNEDEQVGLLLEDNTFSDSAGAGVFLDGASATLSGNTYEDNTTDLIRQACGETEAPEGMDEEDVTTTEICPDYDYLPQELVLTPYLEEAEVEY
ncbi:MAG: right-handed parallel beta-helix repeat-containing protein [Myxococcota bacterium]|nr:right-handed parallel beta-helix repeat-containing protein [Myxococcota bacterium]